MVYAVELASQPILQSSYMRLLKDLLAEFAGDLEESLLAAILRYGAVLRVLARRWLWFSDCAT